jgi:hypothetical protein
MMALDIILYLISIGLHLVSLLLFGLVFLIQIVFLYKHFSIILFYV